VRLRSLEIDSTVNYSSHMIEVRKSDTFDQWLKKLRDVRAVARINIRIERLMAGNPGEVAPVGEGVSELKIDYGPGYRVYFTYEGDELVVLLCGGDKKSQAKDIKEAKRIAKEWKAQR
jgi:putative addiction module killer protein